MHVESSIRRRRVAEEMLDLVVYAGDREFQTAGAMMLNALDWKLILVCRHRRIGLLFYFFLIA